MASGEDVPYESGYYYKEQEDDSNISSFFIEVGAVVKAPSDVHIDANEKERGTVGVEVTDKSSVVDISANMAD